MSAEPTHKDTESRGNVSHVAHLIRTRRGVKLSSLDLDLQPHNLSYIYILLEHPLCAMSV